MVLAPRPRLPNTLVLLIPMIADPVNDAGQVVPGIPEKNGLEPPTSDVHLVVKTRLA